MDLRQKIVDQMNAVIGTNDEDRIYGGEPGDPGLVGGPDSLSWEINGDMGAIAVAGMAAIIMEVAHPSVMAGVEQQSTYRTDPLRRAKTTMGYVLQTTFGSTPAATAIIERVHKIHGRINGTRPDGVPYRALDPELIAWVHTCIPWAIMTAFDRYSRPLSTDEKSQYLREQAVIGRMGGADTVPETVADLEAYVERVRPQLAVTEQTRSFMRFLAGDAGDLGHTPPLDQWNRRQQLKASMSLMPVWAQRLTGQEFGPVGEALYGRPVNTLTSRIVRWAYGTPAAKRIATERALGTGTPHPAGSEEVVANTA